MWREIQIPDLVVVERLPWVVVALPAGGGGGALEDEQLPLRHPDVLGGQGTDAHHLTMLQSSHPMN